MAKKIVTKEKVKKVVIPEVPEKTLVLRTCAANMSAHGGFKWPRLGAVECPDWDSAPRYGGGLHGLAWGNGDWSLLSAAEDAVWMVVEVETSSIINIDKQNVKFPRGNVLFSGSRVEAIIRVLCGSEAMSQAYRDAVKWQGESSGDSSTAASSGYSSTAASSGDYSTAASSGYSSTAASSGDSGIAVTIGSGGHAKAGPNGLVIVTYWVPGENRYRACVGNVGEDGIEADVWYGVEGGKLEKVAR